MNAVFLTFLTVAVTFMGTTNAFAEILKEDLCRTPPFVSAKISPDGRLIAQVGADEMGIMNVSLISIKGDHSNSQKLSFFETPEIIQFFWSADSKKVLLLKDENGTGQLNLHGFDVQSKNHISYTEHFPKVNAKIIKLSSKENKAIVGLNQRNPHFHDLYLLDLNSGDLTFLLENNTFAQFLVSEDLEIILKMQINSDGSWTVFTNDDKVFVNLSSEDAFQTEFLSYDSNANAIYMLDNRSSNTNQLTKKLLASSFKEEVLGRQSYSDVDEVLFIDGKPQAYASYYTQKKWHVLDPSVEKDINFLEKQTGTNFEIVSQSQDNKIWIVSNSIPDKGDYFWIYQRKVHSLVQLAPSNSDRSLKEDFSKMYEMIAKARDGEELVCYYTLPKEYDKGGYVDFPIPLVVVPHGGPFKVRDKFKFNRYHQ